MKVLLLILGLVVASQCILGADVSQLFSVQSYKCLKQAGYTFVIPRGYCSYGGVDQNAVQSLKNARQAGFITDVYLFPCRSKSAKSQVDQMFASIPSELFGMVWIDVQTNNSPGCGWSGYDQASQCNFVTQIINAVKSHGKVPGIYASAYMWTTIFGSRNACPSVASQQLWYAHYDMSPSFSDFSAFGGWSKPNIKQFQGTNTVCGISLDKDYYP